MAKKATKKAATTKAPAKPVPLSKLSETQLRDQLGAVHMLEQSVERARTAFDNASAKAKDAMADLKDAEDSLRREIHEQRVGLGPLFEGTEADDEAAK